VVESVEGTGRTVDEAIENALDDLGLERDEVTITVLSEGGQGQPARVAVTPVEGIEIIDDLDDDMEDDELDEEDADAVDEADGEEPDELPRNAPVAAGAAAAAAEKAPADPRAIAALTEEILAELLDYMDLPSDVVIDRAELDDGLPSIELSIHGEFGGILIGRHGETLSAIQFLLGLMTSRRAGRRVRVVVDVEGYRDRREKLLRDMALRAADRAQRYRQPIFMDPMLPAERRVVHMTLAEHSGVSTHSIGEGDNRRVVVSPRQAQRFGGYGTS
jgi:spoIIIJ-associated protein